MLLPLLRPSPDLAHPGGPGTTTVLVALGLLAAVTVWAWWRRRRATSRPHLVALGAVVLVTAVLWLVVDPVHGPTIVTIGGSHGVTPADLLVLPALVALAQVAWSGRRRRRPPTRRSGTGSSGSFARH